MSRPKQQCVCPACHLEHQTKLKENAALVAKYSKVVDTKYSRGDTTVFVKTLTGSTLTLFIQRDEPIFVLKLKLQRKAGIPPIQQRMICGGRVLSNDGTVTDYGLRNDSTIHLVLNLRGGGMAAIQYDPKQEIVVFGHQAYDSNPFQISSFHVSCKSDPINGENMAGIVLYSYDNRNEWTLNKIRCKSGYIILKRFKRIEHIKSSKGVVHGKCYKFLFDTEIDDKVVGGGFALVNGEWKFNSYSFNVASVYHDNKKAMHKMEQQCILAAVSNWKKGIQNTYCKDIAKNYKDSCNKHGFY